MYKNDNRHFQILIVEVLQQHNSTTLHVEQQSLGGSGGFVYFSDIQYREIYFHLYEKVGRAS